MYVNYSVAWKVSSKNIAADKAYYQRVHINFLCVL